jgi:hypothetical protein
MDAHFGTVWEAEAPWRGGEPDQSGLVRWDVEGGLLELDLEGDWRGRCALQLELQCPRRTGARIDLQLFDRSGDLIGGIPFAADWIGDNLMQVWLHAFTPAGPDERWADVGRVRMSCREPGLWPTVLLVGRIDVTDHPAGWEVNESDTVIDMAWHQATADVESWRIVAERTSLQPESAPVQELTPVGYVFAFPQSSEPGRLAVERHFDLDISGHSEILAKFTWDKEATLKVNAIVDGGREIPVFDDAQMPEDNFHTAAASLAGASHLDRIRLEIAEPADRTLENRQIGMGLFWILLRRPTPLDDAPVESLTVRLAGTYHSYPEQVETAQRRVRQIPFKEPPLLQRTPADPLAAGLPFGFYVSRENIADLRRATEHPPTNGVFKEIVAEAERAIATELVDRNYYGSQFGGGIGLPKGLRGAGMRVFAPIVALAHLLTEDDRYAAAARRWILRAARSDDWRGDHGGCVDRPQAGERLAYWDSFTGWYPLGFSGHMNHHFWVSDVAHGIAAAYEMLYHCFDESERDEIETSFADHGVYVLYDRLRHARERFLNTNQGVLIAVPLLMQSAFLRKRDQVFEDMYQFTVEFLTEYGKRPWNEEGVCTEGPGYGVGTVEHLVEALFPLAACVQKSVHEVITPEMLAVSTFAQHCRSTWAGRDPHFVGLGDGSYTSWVQSRFTSFFAAYGNDPVARYFYEESYSGRPLASIESLLTLAAFDRAPAAEEPCLPPAKVYTQQPMAFFRTGWRPGDTLVVMTNMRLQAGHEHFDRGSVIFEFNGEPLLLDPGMIFYGSPNMAQYRATCAHSTLTFSQRNQLGTRVPYETAIDAFLSTSGDRCPGRDGGIDWVVAGAAAVYPEAEKVIRHVIFLRPDICVLVDEVKTTEPEPVELNFNCLGRLSRAGNLFESTTDKNRLLIHSQSADDLDYSTNEWRTSVPDTPSYRLIVSRSREKRECAFLTALVAHPLGEASPVIESLAPEGGLGVRIRRGNEEVVVLVEQPAGATISVAGVTTDARMAVTRQIGSVVTGAMMLDGTCLSVEGAGDLLSASEPGLAGGVLVDGDWQASKL